MKIVLDESDFEKMPANVQFQLKQLILNKMDIGNYSDRHQFTLNEEKKLIQMQYIDFLKIDQEALLEALFVPAPESCKSGSKAKDINDIRFVGRPGDKILLNAQELPWEDLFHPMLNELGVYHNLDACSWEENTMRIKIDDDNHGMTCFFGNDMSYHDFRKEKHWGKALLFMEDCKLYAGK